MADEKIETRVYWTGGLLVENPTMNMPIDLTTLKQQHDDEFFDMKMALMIRQSRVDLLFMLSPYISILIIELWMLFQLLRHS